MKDLRLALRNLVKAPGLSLTAVLTLAVGIGGATAMYSTLRALVVHPFDFPASDSLVQVWSGESWPLSALDFLDIREQSTSFEAFGGYSPATFNVGAEEAQAVAGVRSTAGVLRAFGVPPLHGRWLEPADDVAGAARVAVIGHALWQQAFAGARDLVGRTIRLNGEDVTVVGIMPPGFEFAGPWVRTEDIQVWVPLSLDENLEPEQRGSHWIAGIARLRPGVTVDAANAEVQGIGKRLSELYPDTNTHKELLVRSLHFEMTRAVGSQVRLLFGATALVLLVACANVASMLLARSARRQGELGVRVALGATRSALARLALAETLVLAAAGALGGLAFAVAGLEMLRDVLPIGEGRRAAMTLDGEIVLFALGASLLVAVLTGTLPAFAAMRSSVAAFVRDQTRGGVGSLSRLRTLRGLVVAQVAVAFVLAIGSALFSAAYLRLLEENQALSTENVVSAAINLGGERYDENSERTATWLAIEERLAALPGVSSVGLASKLPLEGGSNTSALVNDEVYDPATRRLLVERTSVTADYFDTMGLTLLRGRNLAPQDDMNEEGFLGVVVNETMVEKAWPDVDPIGQVMRSNNSGTPFYTATVVGVVEDVRQWGADAEVQPEMYTTPPRHWGNRVYVNVRSAQPAITLVPLVRAEIAKVDADLALDDVRTLEQLVRQATSSERAVAMLVNLFMAIALGLVAVGLYGTLSFHVARRTRETGLRMAVGASRGDVLRLVLGQGFRWVGAGVVLGIAGAFALSTLLENLVYGMDRLEMPPLLLATVAVALAGITACLVPALRASRLDPIAALRMD